MSSGEARVLQEKDSLRRRVRIMHQHKTPWSEVWDNNPRLARPEEKGDFIIHYARSLTTNQRGYHSGKSEQRWTYNFDYRPTVGEIYFTPQEKSFAEMEIARALGAGQSPGIIIEPNVKLAASQNKKWGLDYWVEFVRIARLAGFRLTQLSYPGARILGGVDPISTPSFRLGCAILSRAEGIVAVEGGLHHASAALNIPGVVIFGGFTPVELTGYPIHRNLGASLHAACGMRVFCSHCEDWMRRIKPEAVLQSLQEVLINENAKRSA